MPNDDLEKLLKEIPPGMKFMPYVVRERNQIAAYWSGDADYEKPVNDWITLMVSLETKQVVGVRLRIPEEESK